MKRNDTQAFNDFMKANHPDIYSRWIRNQKLDTEWSVVKQVKKNQKTLSLRGICKQLVSQLVSRLPIGVQKV